MGCIEMLGEFGDVVSSTPGAASKLGDTLANGEVGAFNEGNIDSTG